MNLSAESKELIRSNFQFKQKLLQILPPDLVEYLAILIAKDQAHQKLLELTKED